MSPPPPVPPPRPAVTNPSLLRSRPYDRVGGSRLTGMGGILLSAVLIGAMSPPQTADRQVFALVWLVLLAALVLGIALPLVAVRQVSVSATSPRDATVGELVPLRVIVTGRSSGCEVRVLDPTGPWHRTAAPGEGELLHLADRRGLFQVVRIEVRVTGPMGVLAAHHVHAVELPVVVEVAPRPLDISWQPAPSPVDGGTDPIALGLPGVDLVRSVRPYTSGDPAHLVHWPSTARAGSLVVREMEPPAPVGQAIILDLQGLGPDTERAAAYALGAARSVLAAGGQLVLCTCERGGPTTGRVRTTVDAGRRIARAVVGPPGEAPAGWPIVEIGR
ncbi:MAG: rane protein [Acidimicrobiales bacterium]|nr:rane protein [Acidimicrobiales bacterium]